MHKTHKFPYVVVLDNIRSALNVGAIFRTCDAAGVGKLYLCGITPYPPHNRIPKTALGAIDFVDWERSSSTLDTISSLKQDGYHLVAVEQSSTATPFNQIEYPAKTALIFGHEISGVDSDILQKVDRVSEIPMFGQKESLNVATTVGIVCYQVSLQLSLNQSAK